MENTVKELKKRIYSFGAAYKPSDVFRDFVELAAIAVLNSYIRDEDWENREERYHVIRRQYKEEAFKIFPELLGVLASGCIRAVKVGNYEDFWANFIWTWERRTSVTDSFLRQCLYQE